MEGGTSHTFPRQCGWETGSDLLWGESAELQVIYAELSTSAGSAFQRQASVRWAQGTSQQPSFDVHLNTGRRKAEFNSEDRQPCTCMLLTAPAHIMLLSHSHSTSVLAGPASVPARPGHEYQEQRNSITPVLTAEPGKASGGC